MRASSNQSTSVGERSTLNPRRCTYLMIYSHDESERLVVYTQ
jgi:hypothetical protein